MFLAEIICKHKKGERDVEKLTSIERQGCYDLSEAVSHMNVIEPFSCQVSFVASLVENVQDNLDDKQRYCGST